MSKLFYAIAAGFLVGIIIAPDKGSHTRAKLASLLDDAAEDSVTYIEEAADKIQGVADTLQTQLVGSTSGMETSAKQDAI